MLASLVFLACLVFNVGTVAAVSRGLAWAADNRIAPALANKPKVNWYYHWADGPVTQMGDIEYVPMFWGPSSWDKWNQRKSEMNKKKPAHLLGFNEPDVDSQANMDPNYAAQVYYDEIVPWGWKGVKIGSPAVAWDLDWMDTFLTALRKKGGYVDFVVLHWYGSWKDLAKFKAQVTAAHQRFGMHIWVTEFGITTASNPTQAQVKAFMMEALAWLDTQTYVDRASWFGCFQSAPDGYATGKNALYNSKGELADMGFWYAYTDLPDKRELLASVAANVRRSRHGHRAPELSPAEIEA
ncbi:glycosyl hydrolase catalytic core-domain-containing protein [Mycena pura]|uniref:Glycosyl hydrolase catalytic core-domain-containing protein n=1 Tax=Mycena pura TaxID=153505 RepID=A0AAD6USV2_9AGAR|nr:glycosyl hydrolase catalytic core-domain-containing protein [Mycena pura]